MAQRSAKASNNNRDQRGGAKRNIHEDEHQSDIENLWAGTPVEKLRFNSLKKSLNNKLSSTQTFIAASIAIAAGIWSGEAFSHQYEGSNRLILSVATGVVAWNIADWLARKAIGSLSSKYKNIKTESHKASKRVRKTRSELNYEIKAESEKNLNAKKDIELQLIEKLFSVDEKMKFALHKLMEIDATKAGLNGQPAELTQIKEFLNKNDLFGGLALCVLTKFNEEGKIIFDKDKIQKFVDESKNENQNKPSEFGDFIKRFLLLTNSHTDNNRSEMKGFINLDNVLGAIKNCVRLVEESLVVKRIDTRLISLLENIEKYVTNIRPINILDNLLNHNKLPREGVREESNRKQSHYGMDRILQNIATLLDRSFSKENNERQEPRDIRDAKGDVARGSSQGDIGGDIGGDARGERIETPQIATTNSQTSQTKPSISTNPVSYSAVAVAANRSSDR